MNKGVIILLCAPFVFLVLSVVALFFLCRINKYDELVCVANTEGKRVVVSVTTIPSRLKYIKNIIENIRRQNFRPDNIYINVPYTSRRMGDYDQQDIDNIPLFDGWVKVSRTIDYGPATKLLGCVGEEKDPETMIITVDDDQTYTPYLVNMLVSEALKNPDAVICSRALNTKMVGAKCTDRQTSPETFFIEGFGGVLYRRKHVGEDLLSFCKDMTLSCFLSDDLVVSTFLHIHNIERIQLCRFNTRHTNEEIDANDALHEANRGQVYQECFKEMMKELGKRYKKPTKLEKFHNELLELLKGLKDISKRFNVKFWVTSGTELGLVRHGGFIPWDDDIDVGMFQSDIDKLWSQQDEIKAMGYELKFSDHIYRLVKVGGRNNPEPYIDIFSYIQSGEKIKFRERANRKRWPKAYYRTDELFPLRKATFEGVVVYSPHDSIRYLDREYGDWRIPRVTHHHHTLFN